MFRRHMKSWFPGWDYQSLLDIQSFTFLYSLSPSFLSFWASFFKQLNELWEIHTLHTAALFWPESSQIGIKSALWLYFPSGLFLLAEHGSLTELQSFTLFSASYFLLLGRACTAGQTKAQVHWWKKSSALCPLSSLCQVRIALVDLVPYILQVFKFH